MARRGGDRGAGDAARQQELLRREQELWERGYCRVAGVDEAGRGSLAGPVVAAAVILPPGVNLPGVDDSKRVSPKRREVLAREVRAQAITVGTGSASPREIDRVGIARATFRAMERALEALAPAPEFVLVDGRRIPLLPWPQEARPRADSTRLSVAAASLVAKVTRDRLMTRLGERYPEYGFGRHKGYGTREHLASLRRSGPSPWHRRSFGWGGRDSRETEVIPARRNWGMRGEEIAGRYLEGLGFRIVERNYRGAGAEVDIIAWDGAELVFVEVKLRRTLSRGDGPSAVTPRKMHRLTRAAASFLARRGLAGSSCRFDVVAVSPGPGGLGRPRVDHYKDAFAGTAACLW